VAGLSDEERAGIQAELDQLPDWWGANGSAARPDGGNPEWSRLGDIVTYNGPAWAFICVRDDLMFLAPLMAVRRRPELVEGGAPPGLTLKGTVQRGTSDPS
jgi:hypothetical protein